MSRRATKPQTGRNVITSIDPAPTDPNLRRVRVDGRIKATLRVSELADAGVDVGDAWSATVAARIDRVMAQRAARERALGCLARRAHTSDELRSHLTRRGFEAPVIDDTLRELAEQGWLGDDDDAALEQARALSRDGRTAPALIRARLEARGVRSEQAKRAADRTTSSPAAAAMRLASDALRQERGGRDSPTAARIARLLTRRGFDDDVIATTLDRLQLSTDQTSMLD
jgi:SOS response regulatory protein OraA/RecX